MLKPLLLTAALLTTAAHADIQFLSALSGDFEIVYQTPNNGEQKRPLSGQGHGFGFGSLNLIPDQPIKIPLQIKDSSGTVLLAGPVPNNSFCLLYLKGSKPALQMCGWNVDWGQEKPDAVVICNLTGKAWKMDFTGQNGGVAKDIPIGAELDFKTRTPLPAGQMNFKVTCAGGVFENGVTFVSPGRYYGLTTMKDGRLALEQLGFLKGRAK